MVKSQENLSELATLINSQELILDTARLLVNIKNMNGSKKNLEEMTLRMDAIDYLGLAYRAGSDETKLVALAAIKEILAKDWYEASISLDQRRIALGDQVELFELISDQDPRLANELIETEVSEKKQDLFRRSVAMRQHVMSG